MNLPRIFIIFFSIFSCSLSLFWIYGDVLLEESFFRISIAACAVFFAPGFAVGLLWSRIRCYSIFETIALSFIFSVIINMIPLPFLLMFKLRSDMVFLTTLVLTLAAYLYYLFSCYGRGKKNSKSIFFWTSAGRTNYIDYTCFAVVIILSVVAYRWGENLFDMANEKLLHLMFCRQYYSLPFSLNDMGIVQGSPPPNLVNLWEYLVSLWAKASGIDVLPVFTRARCLIPLVGLSFMFTLLRLIMMNMAKARMIFVVILLLVFAEIMLVSPSGLDWVQALDPTRGIMNFMGTIHHADSAIDILIPLGLTVCMLFIWRTSLFTVFLMFAMLAISFLWHPREFFQFAMYFGLFGLLMAIISRRRNLILKKYALGMGIFVTWALLSFICTESSSKPQAGYDEFLIKQAAVTQAFDAGNIAGLRNPFIFPIHYNLAFWNSEGKILSVDEMKAQAVAYKYHYYWLILTALSLLVIIPLGRRNDRTLGLYTALLWIFALAWNFSMLILTALTYSEFFMTTPRLIYLFSWICIADAIYLIATRIAAGQSKTVKYVLLALTIGCCLILTFIWKHGLPFLATFEYILGVFVFLSVPVLFWLLMSKRHEHPLRLAKGSLLIAIAITLVLVWFQLPKTLPKLLYSRPATKWHEAGNVFGYSSEFIRFLKSVPEKSIFFSDPRQASPVFVYAPVYIAVFPSGAVTIHLKDLTQIEKKQHPLLGAGDGFDAENAADKAIKDWFSARNIDYILLQDDNYSRCAPLLRRKADLYTVVFENPETREIVFKTNDGNAEIK